MKRLIQAANFAALKHRDQRRKDVDASPYINHPLQVAGVLASEGNVADVELLCAALLHDTIEDTQTTSSEIEVRFGLKVTQIVLEVTDDKSLEKQERKRLQIEHTPTKSDFAKQLKLADKICNVRDLTPESPATWSTERKLEYIDWAEKVVAGCRGVNPMLDEKINQELAAARIRLS